MYNVSEETKKKIIGNFGKTEQLVEKDVRHIKKWMKTQPHLPEIMDEVKIRNFLNLCKFNIEKTKERITAYYTTKSKYPQFFEDCNPKLPNMRNIVEENHMCNHPQLLKGKHRVFFIKFKGLRTSNPEDFLKQFFSIFELRLQNDFMNDDVIIIDFQNVTFWELTKTPPTLIYRSYSVYKNVLAFRMKEAHFINSPSYITFLIKIFKFVMKPKIFERFKVYGDAQVLNEILPTEILPKDYGGEGLSLDELDDIMRQEFDKNQEYFDRLDTLKVQKGLRSKEK